MERHHVYYFSTDTFSWCYRYCDGVFFNYFCSRSINDKTATLDTIVVTASRSEEKLKNVPARMTVIDQKTIEQILLHLIRFNST
jgi:outer membrane receptor for ferrienterochelin and colicin